VLAWRVDPRPMNLSPSATASAPALPRPRAGALRSLARGRSADPAWVRPALLGVLAVAALLCLWNLTISGWSNEYYAAAARAGSESWKAWFFGSLDPASFITVDKPPLSLWLMGLSARVLGYSSFSVLLPQALCTIGAVGLLFATVRRVLGPRAGIIAAAALAITPVTVAIGRVNNPDALLVLLLVASGYLLVRALESGRTKHLVWCGVVVGLAFMTKMLQGWMVVPALAAAYLLAGPPAPLTRVRQLLLAGVAMVAASAAWPVAVALWPGSTPYIGGSEDGTVWNLIFGYNGFGRLTGEEGGGMGGTGFGGAAGLLRMFNEHVGGQVAWLLPLAGVGLVAGLWMTRRAPRTDLRRAGFVLFGVWALVHVAVFSTQKGIFHPYYVSALAPAVAALCGGGLVMLGAWARRSWAGLAILDATLAGSAWLAVELLGRTPDFAPWLRIAIPVAAALALLASPLLRLGRGRRLLAVGAAAAVVALGAGPASYSIASVGQSLSGNNVIAGPASAGGGFGGGGGMPARAQSQSTGPSGGMGGSGSLGSEAIAWLQANQGSATYLLAAVGSQTTAQIIIDTGEPVVTIGGFNGQDPAPTVSQLAKLVADGELKYVLLSASGGAGGPGGGGSSDITTWVQEHGTAVDGVSVGSGTLYAVSV
jgi:4-amino-4-deoxy-L-arabinose transferase-like glycosyltransferase